MWTAYIQRWTEDLQEDMDVVRAENDIFIDGSIETSAGLIELEELLRNTG